MIAHSRAAQPAPVPVPLTAVKVEASSSDDSEDGDSDSDGLDSGGIKKCGGAPASAPGVRLRNLRRRDNAVIASMLERWAQCSYLTPEMITDPLVVQIMEASPNWAAECERRTSGPLAR